MACSQEQATNNLYYIMLYRVHHEMGGIEIKTLVGINFDSIDICKSIYHTIAVTAITLSKFKESY